MSGNIWIIIGVLAAAVAAFAIPYGFHKKANEAKASKAVRPAQDISVTRSVRTSVLNDLKYSIPVALNIQDQIRNKEFIVDSDMFRSLYSPNVSLPSTDLTAVLHTEVLAALDEYQRRLSECAKHRATYLQKLENKSHDKVEVALLTYCIALDSVVRTAMTLVNRLDEHYPDEGFRKPKIPDYRGLDETIDELVKAIGGAVTEREE